MDLNQYQALVWGYADYPRSNEFPLAYPTVCLTGEAGEVAEKVKKIWRDNNGVLDERHCELLKKELGDVLCSVAMLAMELGIPLETVAISNIEKLDARKYQGCIKGDGDEREVHNCKCRTRPIGHYDVDELNDFMDLYNVSMSPKKEEGDEPT